MKDIKGPRKESLLDKIEKFREKRSHISTTQIIAVGFLIAIVIGAILLSLPIASADGTATPFLDSLFTATTSICVTGLTTVTMATHWSVFGKIIILILIQLLHLPRRCFF